MQKQSMTRDDVLRICQKAWARDQRPNLRDANLHRASLRRADLNRAALSWADMSWADLSETNLRWANLYGANLHGANLHGASLSGANLSGANLRRADLSEAVWGGLSVDGLHPYRCLLVPLPTGWQVTIGCWIGTVAELRDLIAQDDNWPEAEGDEIAHRRPLLAAFADMCDSHITAHPTTITDLAECWGIERNKS